MSDVSTRIVTDSRIVTVSEGADLVCIDIADKAAPGTDPADVNYMHVSLDRRDVQRVARLLNAWLVNGEER